MLRIRNALIHIVVLGLLITSGLLGIFASMGICAAIYGPQILNTALGNPPDRSHPAFWLFLILMVPATLIGYLGGIFAFALPIYAHTRIPISHGSRPNKRFFAYYIRILERLYARSWPDGGSNSVEQSDDRAKRL